MQLYTHKSFILSNWLTPFCYPLDHNKSLNTNTKSSLKGSSRGLNQGPLGLLNFHLLCHLSYRALVSRFLLLYFPIFLKSYLKQRNNFSFSEIFQMPLFKNSNGKYMSHLFNDDFILSLFLFWNLCKEVWSCFDFNPPTNIYKICFEFKISHKIK